MNKVKKLREFSKWKVTQEAIDWTLNFIKNGLKRSSPFIWATSHYSIQFENGNSNVILKDVNFNYLEKPEESFENLSRTIKTLEKIGYVIEIDKQMVINLHPEERLVNGSFIEKRF